MPTYREEDVKELSLEDKRAACLHCWGRDFGNCDKCALKGINRRTYEELERQLAASEEARKKAEEDLHFQACLTKELLPYQERAIKAEQRAEAAEQRIKASQEQEPIAHLESWPNDRVAMAWIGNTDLPEGTKAYLEPPIPPEVEELQRENAELTRKLAEQQSQNNFDAARLRRLCTFCGVAAPDSDEELLQVAGVVIGSCLRNLTKLLEEAKRQAVPEDTARLDFVLSNDAFIVKRNSGNRADIFQLWTQDEDEEYSVLHDKSLFFTTAREAIDAAMLSAAPQPERKD